MKKQSSITLDDFTNFLRSGAFIRWQSEWYLFWSLSSPQVLEHKGPSLADGIYSCDFISGQVKGQFFSQMVKLTHQKYKEILDNFKKLKGFDYDLENEGFEPEWKPIDKESFRQSFENIKESIRLGKITKAVPIGYQDGTLKYSSYINAFKKFNFLMSLKDSPDNLIPYGQWSEEQGFVGVTPELFFYIDGNVLSTMAMAGTSPKETTHEDFLNDEKERYEHALVIQDISEKLESFGRCLVGTTKVHELPFLNHLKTDIQVELAQEASFLEILKKLHPTSALGIYPRSSYWEEFIHLPNQASRNTFGAPWGFKLSGQVLFIVGIRRMEWNFDQVRVAAGCGIVEKSDFEKEFSEIERKINSVKKVFVMRKRLRENVIHE